MNLYLSIYLSLIIYSHIFPDMAYEYMLAIHYLKYMSLVSYEMIYIYIYFMKYNMYYKSLPSHDHGHLFIQKFLNVLDGYQLLVARCK
jgi:hypothetical protein